MRPQYSNEPKPMQGNYRPMECETTAAPENPHLIALAQNLRSYLIDLADEQAMMDRALYGAGTGHSDDCANELEPTNLERVLTDACSRAACCVGAQRTMNGRL